MVLEQGLWPGNLQETIMSRLDGRDFDPQLLVDRRQLLGWTAVATAAAVASAVPYRVDAKPNDTSAGSVGDLLGEALAEAEGKRRALKLDERVFVDETISTGPNARLLLNLGQRTTLRLGGKARLKIESYLVDAGGELVLANGALQFERKGKPATSDLKIRSAYGLITVRGTQFFAGPSNGVFGVFVAQGRVEVAAGGKTVSVGAMQGTNIARPGDKPSDPLVWGEARIRAALASVRR